MDPFGDGATVGGGEAGRRGSVDEGASVRGRGSEEDGRIVQSGMADGPPAYGNLVQEGVRKRRGLKGIFGRAKGGAGGDGVVR